jgi:hypothetical protein
MMMLSRVVPGMVLMSFLSVMVCSTWAAPIGVRYPQGSSHGFLALRTLDGKMIATGQSTQTVRGDQVTSKLVFRFRDGSIDEDETVFTQRRVFRLVRDHHIQHGPSFPKPIDFLIDVASGELGRVNTNAI